MRQDLLARPGTLSVIHFKRTEMFDPIHVLIWVAINIQKIDCWQILCGGFTPKSLFEGNKEIHLFMLEAQKGQV